VRAAGPGPDAYRSAIAYGPDPGYDGEVRETMAAAGFATIAEFHSHPRSAVAVPSRADLNAFVSQRRALGLTSS
jgi:hypothetical protein